MKKNNVRISFFLISRLLYRRELYSMLSYSQQAKDSVGMRGDTNVQIQLDYNALVVSKYTTVSIKLLLD